MWNELASNVANTCVTCLRWWLLKTNTHNKFDCCFSEMVGFFLLWWITSKKFLQKSFLLSFFRISDQPRTPDSTDEVVGGEERNTTGQQGNGRGSEGDGLHETQVTDHNVPMEPRNRTRSSGMQLGVMRPGGQAREYDLIPGMQNLCNDILNIFVLCCLILTPFIFHICWVITWNLSLHSFHHPIFSMSHPSFVKFLCKFYCSRPTKSFIKKLPIWKSPQNHA